MKTIPSERYIGLIHEDMEGNKSINILTIRFEEQLRERAIPFFRGAVIASMEGTDNGLFHNHVDDNYRYSYPLIQYKTINNKAAITCINEGVDSVLAFITKDSFYFKVGNENMTMHIDSIKPRTFCFDTTDHLHKYKLRKWLPLNKDNLRKYNEANSLIEQINLLERILKGNILSMAKGVGIVITDEIEAHITAISDPTTETYKNQPLLSFDIDFACNITLPEHLGLGKNASQGHGVIINKQN